MSRASIIGTALSAAIMSSMSNASLYADMAAPAEPNLGRKTSHTLHKQIGRSKYMPHQGRRECARRMRQMAAAA